jgi:hypothetical protein
MTLVGEVEGKIAILVDDMADTCGTLCKAADVLMAGGAKEVVAIVTHAILSGDAAEKVSASKLSRLVVTDTVPHDDKKKRCAKIDTIDVAPTVSPLSRVYKGIFANKSKHRLPRRADVLTMVRVCHFCLATRFKGFESKSNGVLDGSLLLSSGFFRFKYQNKYSRDWTEMMRRCKRDGYVVGFSDVQVSCIFCVWLAFFRFL